MTPTYCSKKNDIHYRYYSCASKVRGITQACDVKNISAAEVEGIVTAKILQILKSPEMVAHAIAQATVDATNEAERLLDIQIIEALKDASKVWDELFPVEQARITRIFIKQVILQADGLDIQIYNEGLNLFTAELTQEAA